MRKRPCPLCSRLVAYPIGVGHLRPLRAHLRDVHPDVPISQVRFDEFDEVDTSAEASTNDICNDNLNNNDNNLAVTFHKKSFGLSLGCTKGDGSVVVLDVSSSSEAFNVVKRGNRILMVNDDCVIKNSIKSVMQDQERPIKVLFELGDFRDGKKKFDARSSHRRRPPNGGPAKAAAVVKTPAPSSDPSIISFAKAGDLPALRSLTASFPESINHVDKFGSTALHWAAGQGNLPCVVFLLSLLPLSKISKSEKIVTHSLGSRSSLTGGHTPLFYASRNGHLNVVKHLIDVDGANPHAASKDGTTIFSVAVTNGHRHVANYLVESHHVDPHVVNEYGCNVAHALALRGSLESMRWARETFEIDLCQRNAVGHTPAMKAAFRGRLDVLEYILVNSENFDEVTEERDEAGYDIFEISKANGFSLDRRWIEDLKEKQTK